MADNAQWLLYNHYQYKSIREVKIHSLPLKQCILVSNALYFLKKKKSQLACSRQETKWVKSIPIFSFLTKGKSWVIKCCAIQLINFVRTTKLVLSPFLYCGFSIELNSTQPYPKSRTNKPRIFTSTCWVSYYRRSRILIQIFKNTYPIIH